MKYFNYTKTVSAWLKCQLMLMLLLGAYAAQAQGTWNSAPTQRGIAQRTFQWSYGGYRFATTLNFDANTHQYYSSLSKTQPYEEYATEHSSYPYFVQLAAALDEDARQLRLTGWSLVEYLTAFVQQGITYTRDPQGLGHDFPKYPIETLWDKNGDCEDVAALLAALLKTFGYDAILVFLPGHMAVGVECTTNNCGGGYNYNGKFYSFIEATADSKIGRIPAQYNSTNASLLAVKLSASYSRPPLPDYVQPVVVAPAPYRPYPNPQPTITYPPNPGPMPTVLPCTCPQPAPVNPWGNNGRQYTPAPHYVPAPTTVNPWGNHGGAFVPAPPTQPYYVPAPNPWMYYR